MMVRGRLLPFFTDQRMIGGCNNHQLLLEGERFLKWLIRYWFGNKRCIEIAGENGARENLRIAGAKLQNDPWIASVDMAKLPACADTAAPMIAPIASMPCKTRRIRSAETTKVAHCASIEASEKP
jgi:hypothetical protein